MEGFRSIFLHNILRIVVRQRIQKLILHQILNAYPQISFMNKSLSVVQKLYVLCESLKFIQYSINSY